MFDVIKKRRSVRQYKNVPVEREKIIEIIDCARLAPSARNVQPWKFVAVTDKELLRKLSELLDTGRFVSGAPLCIAVFCEDTKYYLEDGSAATQNILLAAEAFGLGSCWIAGDKKPYREAVSNLLGAPDNYRLISLIAIGYPEGEVKSKAKKSVEEVIFWERFH
ncbi:MAG: nitroreductase family protein [Firmicutes bacterium HGW-Firmicutes-13]|nr:MAG: nitroreductase family protein [Firmicutes bacterium HGW-Firmicutes-13]